MQQQTVAAAADVAHGVAARFQTRLDDDLDQVRLTLADCAARGLEPEALEEATARLHATRPIVDEVYVFMNPWGFLWPASSPTSALAAAGGGSTGDRGSQLVATLRAEIASSGNSSDAIRILLDDAAYCFAPLDERSVLYAGFRACPAAWMQRLTQCIELASDSGYSLSATGPGVRIPAGQAEKHDRVIVTDSLGQEVELTPTADRSPEPLASVRLGAPFDYIEVSAFEEEPVSTGGNRSAMARLHAWGIVMLVAGVLLGVGLVVRDAALQVREARSRGDFMIGVSHDLRTPLASMRMLAESLFLDHVAEAEKRRQFAGAIMRESERLGQLIERVLFLIRFGQNSLAWRFADVNVGSVVASAARTFCAKFPQAGQKDASRAGETVTTWDCETMRLTLRMGIVAPEVHADESALTQVFLNLLDNAVKYSTPAQTVSSEEHNKDDGGVPPASLIDVSVTSAPHRRWSLGPKREWVRIAVRDNGIGIRHDQLRKLFRRYYRTPEAASRNVSGLGLGLAMCMHIARAHGGWIEVESDVGKGSTFSVLLPVRRRGLGVRDC